MEGTVKWFSKDKGYGFITSSSEKDYFLHVSDINGAILPKEGDRVSFDSKQSPKGLQAINVTIIEKSKKHNRAGDRVSCPACNKKIVPRIITYRGEPQKSVCPYCSNIVTDFTIMEKCTACGNKNEGDWFFYRSRRDRKDCMSLL